MPRVTNDNGEFDVGSLLPKLAVAAASKVRVRKDPLAWSEALKSAPWNAEAMPAAWERAFREAYASRLVERGIAKPAKASGPSGKKSGKTLLAQRKVYATEEEFADQDRRMRAAGGTSWSDWARKKLSE